jgi:tRNA threonylcarbamoyl adenosine modification protein YjeE
MTHQSNTTSESVWKSTLQDFLSNKHKNEQHSVTIELEKDHLPELGAALAHCLPAGTWLSLEGDLGAGKTALVAAIGTAASAAVALTSPTFSIIHSVELTPPHEVDFQKIVHLDLYRLKHGKELCYLGLESEFTLNSIVFLEWASNVEEEDWQLFFETTGCLVPQIWLHVEIERSNEALSRRYVFSRKF